MAELVEGFTQVKNNRYKLGLVLASLILLTLGNFAGCRNSRSDAGRDECQLRLKKLSAIAKEYARYHKGAFPDLTSPAVFGTEFKRVLADTDIFTCPESKQVFQGNASLSEVDVKSIKDPAGTILFYEEDTHDSNGRNVAYVDGRGKWLTEENWQEQKKYSGIQ
ncbi:MAG TPA: hypothetical protein VF719_10155 [Abditibacteriaceae bacterium]